MNMPIILTEPALGTGADIHKNVYVYEYTYVRVYVCI